MDAAKEPDFKITACASTLLMINEEVKGLTIKRMASTV